MMLNFTEYRAEVDEFQREFLCDKKAKHSAFLCVGNVYKTAGVTDLQTISTRTAPTV